MLGSLGKEFQLVVTEHEDMIKQLLIQTYPILSATGRLDKHIYYSEMANAFQKMEEICSYIRAMLEGAVNLWLCECSTRWNYSDFENLYVIQEEVKKELCQLNPGPQASCLQDGRGPSDRNKTPMMKAKALSLSDSQLVTEPVCGRLTAEAHLTMKNSEKEATEIPCLLDLKITPPRQEGTRKIPCLLDLKIPAPWKKGTRKIPCLLDLKIPAP
ncbi:uncharacterized protein LOC111861867 [Cryptotermes secundus]|uniref:uncharacterized protein LOC111861867 n=1 Tax=Cryptotermes secundus TaxID=105785 RepID=UPI001454D34F|nr:uncharacterized protein LOC111861867 [Cryptotermes secundus]